MTCEDFTEGTHILAPPDRGTIVFHQYTDISHEVLDIPIPKRTVSENSYLKFNIIWRAKEHYCRNITLKSQSITIDVASNSVASKMTYVKLAMPHS